MWNKKGCINDMKNRNIGIGIWGLSFILANLLLFVLENGKTITFWITAIFVWTGFVLSLLFQILIWKRMENRDDYFLHMPAITISYIYMAVQIPVSVIFSMESNVISSQTAIIINAIIFVIAWATLLGSFVGNNHIRKVNSRQKNYHKEL